MTMQAITCGFGKVTLKTNSATLAAFKVEPTFDRVLASKALTKVGQTIRVPVSDKPQFDGWLYQDSINVPDGTILAVQLQVRSNASPIRDGAVFILARHDAPMLLITAHLPTAPGASLQAATHTAFSGRGDILSIDDLSTYDIVPGINYCRAFGQEDEISECFSIEEIATGKEKPVLERVVNSKGDVVVFNTTHATRRIRIRR